MYFRANRHSPSTKQFLGTTIAAGTPGPEALQTALNTIANHANVGPYIGRQLIQRLVASNPSPAYVGRVTAAFNDNGAGVRGDLKAVVRAVLLDVEARRTPLASETTRGKLREPILRFVQWGRTFKVSDLSGKWAIGDLSNPATALGQSPMRSPSVFNFFRPGYVPPNSPLGDRQLTVPELQITHESSVAGWANYAQNFLDGVGTVKADYTAELALSADPPALVRRLSLLLAADRLSTDTINTIASAVATIPAPGVAGQSNRVYAALHLVLCSPEYLVQV